MEWHDNTEGARSQFTPSIEETRQETLSPGDRHFAHSDKILDILDKTINTQLLSIEKSITDSKYEIEKRIEHIEKLFDDATFNRKSTKWIIVLTAASVSVGVFAIVAQFFH